MLYKLIPLVPMSKKDAEKSNQSCCDSLFVVYPYISALTLFSNERDDLYCNTVFPKRGRHFSYMQGHGDFTNKTTCIIHAA